MQQLVCCSRWTLYVWVYITHMHNWVALRNTSALVQCLGLITEIHESQKEYISSWVQHNTINSHIIIAQRSVKTFNNALCDVGHNRCLARDYHFTHSGYHDRFSHMIRNTSSISFTDRHKCVVSPTVRDSVFILNVHWCFLRKSMPITIGASISATTIMCGQMSLPVPSCKSNCTVPKDSVALPSAKRSLPLSMLRQISEPCDNLDNTEGCTTLIVDPVSSKPMTDTPLTSKGRYRLPVVSVSSSISLSSGPNM